jgi:hypothetical protein
MKLTIVLTDEQYAGLSFVTAQSNATLPDEVKPETPEEYAQRVWSGACDSYVQQVRNDQHNKLSQGLDLLTPEQLAVVLKAVPADVLDQIGVEIP